MKTETKVQIKSQANEVKTLSQITKGSLLYCIAEQQIKKHGFYSYISGTNKIFIE